MEDIRKPFNEKPLVAICIPVFNGAKFIIQTLDSINKQTYENFECHIVNNASTDDTGKLVKEFIKGKKRFHLHNHNDYVDMVSNWNRTINYIPEKAKYFKLVQADDYIFPHSIETHVKLLEQNPSAGIASSYRLIGTLVNGFGLDYFEGNCQNGRMVLIKHLAGMAEITGAITHLFFRIEHLKKVPAYPDVFNPEDFHFDTRLAYEMYLISDLAFAYTVLGITRRHNNAATMTTVVRYNTLLNAKECQLYRFKEFFPELNSAYLKVRRIYAYFLFKCYLKNNKECLKWHSKYLKRKIKLSEFIAGILWENKLGARLARTLGLFERSVVVRY